THAALPRQSEYPRARNQRLDRHLLEEDKRFRLSTSCLSDGDFALAPLARRAVQLNRYLFHLQSYFSARGLERIHAILKIEWLITSQQNLSRDAARRHIAWHLGRVEL